VLAGMKLGGLSRVMLSLFSVPIRYVGVMTGFLVVSTFVVLGRFTVVFRRVLVVFRGCEVVLCAFMCHFVTFRCVVAGATWLRRLNCSTQWMSVRLQCRLQYSKSE
jgi:hypothetical protein